MFKAASSPEQEPDFSSMAPVILLGNPSEMVSSSSGSTSLDYSSSQCFSPKPSTRHNFSLLQDLDAQYFQPPTHICCSVSDMVFSGPVVDGVLDEAIDELFLTEEADHDTLNDLCLDWYPDFESMFEISLNSDMQLDFMVEKFLEE